MLKNLWSDLHQSYFVVSLAVGTIAGTILALVFRINYFASPVWILFSGLLLLWAFLKPKLAFLVIALVAGMILAFFRASNELMGEDYIRQFYGKDVEVAGVVNGDPETDEKGTKVKLGNLKFGEEKREMSGNIFVTLKENEEIARSDEIVLSGKMMNGFGIYAGYMYQPRIVRWQRPEP